MVQGSEDSPRKYIIKCLNSSLWNISDGRNNFLRFFMLYILYCFYVDVIFLKTVLHEVFWCFFISLAYFMFIFTIFLNMALVADYSKIFPFLDFVLQASYHKQDVTTNDFFSRSRFLQWRPRKSRACPICRSLFLIRPTDFPNPWHASWRRTRDIRRRVTARPESFHQLPGAVVVRPTVTPATPPGPHAEEAINFGRECWLSPWSSLCVTAAMVAWKFSVYIFQLVSFRP